jgi:hypothetical protein
MVRKAYYANLRKLENMKRIVALCILFFLYITSCVCETIKKSQSAIPNEYHSKWGIEVNGDTYTIDDQGIIYYKDKQIQRIQNERCNGYTIDDIQYGVIENNIIINIAYYKDDLALSLLFKYDITNSDINYIASIQSMNAEEFIYTKKYLVFPGQFAILKIEFPSGQILWLNKKVIGTDYHYRSQIIDFSEKSIKIRYLHYMNGKQVYDEMTINTDNGSVIE